MGASSSSAKRGLQLPLLLLKLLQLCLLLALQALAVSLLLAALCAAGLPGRGWLAGEGLDDILQGGAVYGVSQESAYTRMQGTHCW